MFFSLKQLAQPYFQQGLISIYRQLTGANHKAPATKQENTTTDHFSIMFKIQTIKRWKILHHKTIVKQNTFMLKFRSKTFASVLPFYQTVYGIYPMPATYQGLSTCLSPSNSVSPSPSALFSRASYPPYRT